MKNDKKNTEHTKSEKGSYMVFYVLSVVLLAYMVFSMVTSYQSFVQYCDNYAISPSDVWFTGFQSILAAAVPCLVYAATLYGIGYLIQHKN
ncbi:hypothetical protein QUV96_10025 [Amedibacillus dolichus]|uniref:Uncharacterized protein n=2 Tax=Amedibacillus dolichus TaxID=31971 RepID=A0ABT7UEB1_9FIRM|nr:hypothetical protein [Amedibacillus dolichus]